MTTRAHEIADVLRQKIICGELKPDLHLQEVPLASNFGTSRTPIREALRLLENENLVVYSANRGFVVRSYSLEDIKHAFDVRAVLEGMACRLVAEIGLSAKHDQTMKDCLERMEEIVGGERWEERQKHEWFELNYRFHQTIIVASGNKLLADLIVQTQRLPNIFDERQRLQNATANQISLLFSFEDTKNSLRDHIEIVSSLRGRQGSRAESLMREHILRSRLAIERRFDKVFG